MTITEEQVQNNYPLKAIKFLHTFDKYLSDETDEHGIKKCKPDSFDVFAEIDVNLPKKLLKDYKQALKEIHAYLDKGLKL